MLNLLVVNRVLFGSKLSQFGWIGLAVVLVAIFAMEAETTEWTPTSKHDSRLTALKHRCHEGTVAVMQYFLQNNQQPTFSSSSSTCCCPRERRKTGASQLFPVKQRNRKRSSLASPDWFLYFFVISFFLFYFLSSASPSTSRTAAI